MRNKEGQEIAPNLYWRDIQALGALSVLFSFLKSKRKAPEQPKPPQPPKHEPPRHNPPPQMQPKDEEMSNEEKNDAWKKFEEKKKDEKNDRPIVIDGRFGDPEWKNTLGNQPGTLLNPHNPDQLPLLYRRRKAANMRRRKDLAGTMPRYWHRLPIDGKIYPSSLMKGGIISRGTVLVDLSGSMSWETNTINLMLDQLPEGTVYGYSGGGASGSYSGRWVLLADRGRAVPPDLVQTWRYWAGMNNLVDIPCLQLLSRLPGPRYWISDTEVTGIDGFTRDLQNVAFQICKESNITIIPHASYLEPYFKGRFKPEEYNFKKGRR